MITEEIDKLFPSHHRHRKAYQLYRNLTEWIQKYRDIIPYLSADQCLEWEIFLTNDDYSKAKEWADDNALWIEQTRVKNRTD